MTKKTEVMPKFMVDRDYKNSDYVVALRAIIRKSSKGSKAKDMRRLCKNVLLALFTLCTYRWGSVANRKGAFIACGTVEDLDQVAADISREADEDENDVKAVLELFKQAKILVQREDAAWWCPMWVSMQSPDYVGEFYEKILDNLKSAKSGKGGKMSFCEQQEFIVASMCRAVTGRSTGAVEDVIKAWAADYVAANGDKATTTRDWAIYCQNDDVPGKWGGYCDEHPIIQQPSTTSKKRRGKTVKPVDVLADDFMDEPVPAIPETAQPEPVQPVMVADEPTETEPEPDQYSGMSDDEPVQSAPENLCEFTPQEPEDWMLAEMADGQQPDNDPAPDPDPIQPVTDDTTDADEDGYLDALVADDNEPGAPCVAGDPAFGELA